MGVQPVSCTVRWGPRPASGSPWLAQHRQAPASGAARFRGVSGAWEETPEIFVAIHEAAHVVVRYWVGAALRNARSVRWVQLDPNPEANIHFYRPRERHRGPVDTVWGKRRVQVDIMMFLAGPLAATKAGSPIDGGYQDRDKAEVWALAVKWDDEPAQEYLRVLEAETNQLLHHPQVWSGVEVLADELIRRRRLVWPEIREVLSLLLDT